MGEFKIGDLVQVVEDGRYDSGRDFIIEDLASNGGERFAVGRGAWGGVYLSRLKLISKAAAATEPESDAIDPGYYTFPGGVEVRSISAHLTSFGGQALQYIARSTRLDGNNKGDTVENIRKAIKFLEWEIERLES